MNRFLSIACVIMVTLLLSGWMNSGQPVSSPPPPPLPSGSSTVEKNEYKIWEDFLEDESSATAKYKAKWMRSQGRHEPTERVDIARKLSIAGELIATDSANYRDYYSYITRHLLADDLELKKIALKGLGNSTGPESLELLFKEIDGSDSYLETVAIFEIGSRYSNSLDDPSLHEDALYIKSRSIQLCSTESENKYVREYCGEHRFYCLASSSDCPKVENYHAD